jgi:hypothetical protein
MSLNITRGKKTGAIRAVIYGTEGIGKSTLASRIPECLVLDTEDGTGQLDVARVVASDWRAIEHAVKELIADTQGFRAVVIDTADWLERSLIDFMLKQSGKKSIEAYGFGKGYTILQEHTSRFLALCDQLIAKGVHVVFVAHAKVTRTSPPDQTDGYDRYELKLTKQVAPLLKEWSDVVLFVNYRIQIVEGSDGKLKAQGGKERIMHAERSAAWDAKNRFGLPPEMPMEFAKIAHLFGAADPRSAPVQEAAAVEAAVASDPAPVAMATKEQAERIEKYKANKVAMPLIETALENCEAIDGTELPLDAATALLAEIEKAVEKPTTSTMFSPIARAWLIENEDTANAYLRHVKWLANSETWRDLNQEKADSIADRFAKFTSAALSHWRKAA